MIRLSLKSDYDGLISLWKEAFGDGEEAIRMFLDSRYKPENTVVAEEDGEIVSMLFLLEGKFIIKGIIYSSYYLYAAATAKSKQNRGLMAKLLAYAENLASSRNIDFICLKPANEGLYGYYNRFGYKTVFTAKIIRSDLSESKTVVLNKETPDWKNVRKEVFDNSDRFEWDDSAIKFAVKQHLYYGGKVISDCNGYCLYTVEDRKCVVKEFCFTGNYINITSAYLHSKYALDEIYFELPSDFECSSNKFEMKNNGMALAVSDSAKSVIDSVENAYLNLTLD